MDGGDQRSRAWTLVEDAIARWRGGERPDAAAFLAAHPEIGARKDLALDLIHEEFCLRREAGDTDVTSTFVARFPQYRSSVVKMLQVEEYGQANPLFAAELAESLWPQPGQKFQGFEVIEPLGRGAMARVYLAREIDMGRRPVVIKVSRHGGHEAHLLGKLEHDNIVAAHSVKHDEETGMTVICMPLLGTATGLDLLEAFRKADGRPPSAAVIGQVARARQPAEVVNEEHLREAIAFSRLSYVEGVVWLAQLLAAGLAAANEVGIAHHDIKPSNVLLAWSGRPMLLDFNLSWGSEYASDRIGGTIAYMAPERIDLYLEEDAIVPAELDPRPDIFSLGALVYELLTGRLPVQPMDAEGTDDAAARRWRAARSQRVAPPSQLNPEVDAAIDLIVLRCLAADPAERYATAAELAAALRAYLLPPARAARWARRHRRGLLVTAAALALGTAAGGAYWATRPPAHEVHYREGLRLFGAGDYPGAIRAFSRSLADKPDSVQALFGRGQSHYWLGVEQFAERPKQLQLAEADFAAAGALDDRGLFWFCAACSGLEYGTGAGHLRKALDAGYDEAAVHCNLGVHWDKSGKRKVAIEEFTHSIQQNDRLAEAYLERAFAYMNEANTGGKSDLLSAAIEDIEMAATLTAPSRRSCLMAARVYALAHKKSRFAEGKQQASKNLLHWIELGGDPQKYRRDPLLGPLVNELEPLPKSLPLAVLPDPPRGVLPPKTADLAELLAGRDE